MKLLKVLKPGLISPFQEFHFKKDKLYTCDDFDTDKNEECSTGYYATDFDGLSYAYRKGLSVWECEVSGKSVEINQFKRRYEKFKLIRKLSIKEIKEGLEKASKKAGYNLIEVSFPINPLHGKPKVIKDKYLLLLKVWDSVGHSIWASIGHSIWYSIGYSVGNSVGNSVSDSVRHSLRYLTMDSIWAYISSLFPNIKKWKYMDHKEGVNPFQSGIDLWKSGIVPIFDGDVWRLHSGKDAEIIWEGKV